jgi:hypothetical protein
VYRVVATAGAARGTASFAVSANASRGHPDETDLLAAWIESSDGHTLTRSSIARLPAMLRESLVPEPRAERWYPMRSAWWIVPFALALSGEWWSRRRRGLA